MTLDLLTTSAQRAYRTCPRLYQLRYELGYRPAFAPDALALGTLGHRGLEVWWRAAQAGGDPVGWWEAASAEVDREADPWHRSRALSLLWGYHARWQDLTWKEWPIRVLAVEAEFSAPLLNPETGAASKTWQRAGKLDAVIEVGGWHTYVVEHKTTSEDVRPGAEYWQRLTIDSQVSNYVAGARALGYEPAGVLYDVLRKPDLRPLKATPEDKRRFRKKDGVLDARQRLEDETPEAFYDRCNAAIEADVDAYYARALVVRLEAEEREAALDIWQTGAQIRDARRLKVWPRNADACIRFGRRCDFWGVCTGTESLDDPTRFRRAETPHEELSMARPATVAGAAE